MFLVWGLTGLWHGAAWNFVLWGLFFAVLLAAEKLWYGHGLEKTRLLKHLYMLPLLAVSFVLFNAADLPAAGEQIAALFGFGGLPAAGVESLYYLRSYAVVLLIALLGATPLPAKAVQRLRDTSAAAPCCPLRSLWRWYCCWRSVRRIWWTAPSIPSCIFGFKEG